MLKGIQEKKESYLEEAMEQYGRLVYSLIAKMIPGDYSAIEELVSDVFVEVWNNADKIDLKRGSLKNMLCLIARSRTLTYMKKKKTAENVIEYSDALEIHSKAAENEMIEKEELQELFEKVKKLKEPTATIFIMRYFYGDSIEWIAEQLGLKRTQVDNYLSRGRKKLKFLLEEAI